MADTTQNERAQDASGLAAAVRERGVEQIEGAKGQLADGAERVAAAVERTADELSDGDGGLSGFGHSVASLMRQLAGGLRERDVEEFARELGALARRNPGVFLAGSVALGFGIARFFKARATGSTQRDHDWQDSSSDWRSSDWQSSGGWQGAGVPGSGRQRSDFDGDESLDLSEGAARRESDADRGGNATTRTTDDAAEQRDTARATETAATEANATPQAGQQDDDDHSQSKGRSSTKQQKRGGKS
jgi:hypothetical protein